MNKWFASLLLLSSSIATSNLEGWGNSDYKIPSLQSPPPPPPLHEVSFPLNIDQEWFVKPSLLVWRPFQDQIDSGFTSVMDSPTDPFFEKNKTQNVNFNWGTGARLTIGKYLPHHEQWDVILASTFFYSDTKTTVHGKANLSTLSASNPNDIILFSDGWNPTILGASTETDLNWLINYFTWDLALGRLFSLTRKVVVHPFICLRSMLIFEKYTNKNESIDLDANSNFFTRRTTFNANNSVWGIGPRIGSDFSYYFSHGFSLQGSLSGAIVMGRYNIQENLKGFMPNLGTMPSPTATLKISDETTNMHANLEANIGLGWEKLVRNHTVRVAPSFIFEVSNWFLINNWAATNIPIPSTPGQPDWGMNSTRRMGDLGFLGFTINLQIDF